jgi:hypothetical protein
MKNILAKNAFDLVTEYYESLDVNENFFTLDLNQIAEDIKSWYADRRITRPTMLAALAILKGNSHSYFLDYEEYEAIENYIFPKEIEENKREQQFAELTASALKNLLQTDNFKKAYEELQFIIK